MSRSNACGVTIGAVSVTAPLVPTSATASVAARREVDVGFRVARDVDGERAIANPGRPRTFTHRGLAPRTPTVRRRPMICAEPRRGKRRLTIATSSEPVASCASSCHSQSCAERRRNRASRRAGDSDTLLAVGSDLPGHARRARSGERRVRRSPRADAVRRRSANLAAICGSWSAWYFCGSAPASSARVGAKPSTRCSESCAHQPGADQEEHRQAIPHDQDQRDGR